MQNKDPKILILYSNPRDSSRLRLDKEHREISRIVEKLNYDSSRIKQLHATTVEDFVSTLRNEQYDVVQFSGHGSDDSIYLEDFFLKKGVKVTAKQIASLLSDACPNLNAAIFISCFSSSSIDKLISVAPYLITVTGLANDDESVTFVKSFYDSYLRNPSIEKAFNSAIANLNYYYKNPSLRPILSRRAKETLVERNIIEISPRKRRTETILVDITDIFEDLEKLDLERDKIYEVMNHKMEIHSWVFKSSRRRAILSLGRYFGIFSWERPNDLVLCERLLKVKPNIDFLTCDVFAGLILSYNDKYVLPYRLVENRDSPNLERDVKNALSEHWHSYKYYFESGDNAVLLSKLNNDQFVISRSFIVNNLRMSDSKIGSNDLKAAILYLEAALSSAHDFIDSLLPIIAE